MTQEQKDKLLNHGDMFNHSMSLLLTVVRRTGEGVPGKDAQDFAYDAFIGFVPEGPGEIMLAQQMIAAFELSMVMTARSKQAEYRPQMESYANIAVKMMGIYERLLQTLTKSRKPQQIVEVQHTHRHVHLNGQVTPGEGWRHISKDKFMKQSNPQPSHLRLAPRCLAKTRRGTACQSPQTKHGRCRIHGGGYGTGAPKGPRNGM
jgi:hypothetical protein